MVLVMQMQRVGSVKMERGFTLIELMVTLAVLAVLVGIAAPNMADYWERNRLVSASESVYSHLQLSRSVALARNSEISVDFDDTGGIGWCMALSENSACDCTAGTNCSLTGMPVPRLLGAEYGDIVLTTTFTGNNTSVTVPRGVVSDNGTVLLRSQASSEAVSVIFSTMGRVRICSDDLERYNDC